jgi:hypothetical protein
MASERHDFSVVFLSSGGLSFSRLVADSAVWSPSLFTRSNLIRPSISLRVSSPLISSDSFDESARFNETEMWPASARIPYSTVIHQSALVDRSGKLKSTVGFQRTDLFTATKPFSATSGYSGSHDFALTSTLAGTGVPTAASKKDDGLPQADSSPLGLIIGIIAGVLVLSIAVGAGIYYRRRQLAKAGDEDESAPPPPIESEVQSYQEQEELTVDFHNPLSDGRVSGEDDAGFSDNMDEDP